MPKRESGTYALEELVSDIDGHTAYRYADTGIGESWDNANRAVDESIMWTVEDDDESDDLDIALTVDAYATLVAKGRAHCPSCEGCTR